MESEPKPRYTQEQKVAAVKYYGTNRTTLTQTCRASVYPTRYVLRRGILEIRRIMRQEKLKLMLCLRSL